MDSAYHEIIATSFRSMGTRFIRYRTEDLALLSDTTCPVSNFSRVETILGRAQEFFIDRDGIKRAFGPFLFGIHSEFWDWVKEIQFVQRKAGALVCRVVLRTPTHKRRLEDFVRDRFASVEIEFEHLQSIAKTARGKHRYFLKEI